MYVASLKEIRMGSSLSVSKRYVPHYTLPSTVLYTALVFKELLSTRNLQRCDLHIYWATYMLVASVKEIRKGVQVQGKTIMNSCRHVAEGLAACTRYGSACTCFWFTPNTSSALWTWVVLSATYVSPRVSPFFFL